MNYETHEYDIDVYISLSPLNPGELASVSNLEDSVSLQSDDESGTKYSGLKLYDGLNRKW